MGFFFMKHPFFIEYPQVVPEHLQSTHMHIGSVLFIEQPPLFIEHPQFEFVPEHWQLMHLQSAHMHIGFVFFIKQPPLFIEHP
jgi:hypothetical protein